MYLEEKVAKLEERIRLLEQNKGSDTIVVKFKRDQVVPYEKQETTMRKEEPVPMEPIEEEKEELMEDVQIEEDKNEWKVLKSTPDEEIYEFNGHTLTLFTDENEKFAQIDREQPMLLHNKEKKAFKQVEDIKKGIELKWTAM